MPPDTVNKVMAITELLLRRLLAHPSRPAVLFFNIAATHKDGGGTGLRPHCGQYGCYLFAEVLHACICAIAA